MTRPRAPQPAPPAAWLLLAAPLACAEGAPVPAAAPPAAPVAAPLADPPAPPPAEAVAAPAGWPSLEQQRTSAAAATAATRPAFTTHPGCEASAAAALGGWLFVGDNEEDRALLALPADGGPAQRWPLREGPGGGPDDEGDTWKIKDIEAIAPHPSGLVVVGSHGLRSPKRGCAPDRDRQRIGDFALDGAGLRLQRAIRLPSAKDERPRAFAAAVDACRAWLGPALGGAEGDWAEALCAALSEAERAAAAGSPEACEATLNVEGAVIDAEGRLWLGLRAPRLPEGAALLRVAEAAWGPPGAPGALRIDGLALVNLPDGAGLRELSAAEGALHLISGPGPDRGAAVAAWSTAPLAALRPGATLQPVWRASLPDHAEGLSVSAAGATVFIDGDKPTSDSPGAPCAQPAGRLWLPTPG